MPRVPVHKKRPIVEGCVAIDVRRWHRDGLLRPGKIFLPSWSCGDEPIGSIRVTVEVDAVVLMFDWRHGGVSEWAQACQRVPLTWSKCHLGGARPWFLCPQYTGEGKSCGRRVAKLYTGDSHLFACRLCRSLVYASQSENPRDRAISQARKLRMRLGGGASILDPVPDKPPRMHQQTYLRLSGKAMTAQERALGLLAGGIGWQFPPRAALAWADSFRQRTVRRRFVPARTAGPS